jgi:hypothetical protein
LPIAFAIAVYIALFCYGTPIIASNLAAFLVLSLGYCWEMFVSFICGKKPTTGTSSFGLACKNGLLEIAKDLLESGTVDINEGSPTPFWHATNEGRKDILKFLMKDKRIKFDEPAPDGTTPLMIAIAKEHSALLPIFEELSGGYFEILRACIKFGRIDLINKASIASAKLNQAHVQQLIDEAILSDDINTLNYLASEMANISFDSLLLKKQSLVEKRYSFDVRTKFGANTNTNVLAALVGLSEKFPEFNDDIQEDWSKNWSPESLHRFDATGIVFDHFIDIETDVLNHVKNRFCCIYYNEELMTEENRNAISCVRLQDCRQNCEQ